MKQRFTVTVNVVKPIPVRIAQNLNEKSEIVTIFPYKLSEWLLSW